MIDKEMAEEYAIENRESNDTKGWETDHEAIKKAFLAGLEAGKDMAETDLATTERYKTKWHRLSAGDTPKENKLYLVKIKDNGLAIAYFNGQHWETRYNLGDNGHCVETVIAWCEIPKFEE